jgi:hypothetical protein
MCDFGVCSSLKDFKEIIDTSLHFSPSKKKKNPANLNELMIRFKGDQN